MTSTVCLKKIEFHPYLSDFVENTLEKTLDRFTPGNPFQNEIEKRHKSFNVSQNQTS